MANAYPLTTARVTVFDVPRDAACTGRSLSIVWSVFLALCGILPAGCHKGIYKPDTLPAEFGAPIADSTRQVDLARVARNNAKSDLIYLGDVLEVTVVTGMEERTPQALSLRVSDSGEVDVPLVGPIHVAGLLLPDAEQAIRYASITREIYRDPHVSVLLKQRKTIRVTVMGAVENPDNYELPEVYADLLAALMAAGGLTDEASTIVEIRAVPDVQTQLVSYNGQRQTTAQTESVRVDLISASEGIEPEYRIQDGSVIMVREQEPKTIQVIGLVRKPNQFDVPPDQDLHLLDALALAGGRTLEIADKVHIVRNLDNVEQPILIEASVREAKRGGKGNLLLAAGDVISVEETPLTFTVGTIQSFVRFGFSAAVP